MTSPSDLPKDPPKAASALIARYEAFLHERLHIPFQPVKFAIGLLFCFSLALLPIGIGLMFRSRPRKRPYPENLISELQSARRSVPVTAFPVMANSLLCQPGAQCAPLLALISFDLRANQLDFMVGIVALFEDLSIAQPHREYLANLLADTEYTRGRRRLLPLELTDNIPVYAVDLAVNPQYLRNHHIGESNLILYCLAEPHPEPTAPSCSGYTRVLPYWVALNLPPPLNARQISALLA